MAVKSTTLPEYPEGLVDGADHVKALVERYALYCASVRATIDDSAGLGDASTADLYTEVSRAVDKRLWFLESHLHGGR